MVLLVHPPTWARIRHSMEEHVLAECDIRRGHNTGCYREATRVALVFLAGMIFGHTAASAESYPTRPIKLVVPAPAGGTNDIIARLVAERLSPALGQRVIVENLAGGAGGTAGAKFVAAAKPDGHTLLLGSVGTFAIAPAIYPDISYDPLKSFAPVAMVTSSAQVSKRLACRQTWRKTSLTMSSAVSGL